MTARLEGRFTGRTDMVGGVIAVHAAHGMRKHLRRHSGRITVEGDR